MVAVSTAWLVGSITIPALTMQIDDGGGAVQASVSAGTYYLRHTTDALSLIDAFATAIEGVTGVPVSYHVQRDRKIYFDTGNSVDISFDADTLRDLLGFTGNLSGTNEYTTTNISPLLWSPGYPAIPKTIPGVSGYTVNHQIRLRSDDGSRIRVVHYSEETWQDLEWQHITTSRLRTTGTVAAQGGTFHQFYEQSAKLGYSFYHYETITEDASSTAAVSWTTPQGPYVLRDMDGDWYRRHVRNADISSPLSLPLHLVDEYS